MQVSLTPELEELVRRKLESGPYGDAGEVIREALRLLAARDELDRLKLERLRAALIAGERSGLVEDFSMDELMAELDEEARAEAQRKKAWAEIRRIIDEPKWRGPGPRPSPEEEEQMIFEEVERLRHGGA